MQRMATHFVGEIRFAFDRQVHGIEMADAPAAPSAAVTIALEGALSGVPSTPVLPIASSSSHRQARPQPIVALSEYAPQAFSVLEERSPRPGVRRLQPCAAPRPPRRYRLTPADRTGRVPFPRKHGVAMPRTDRRRFPVLYRGIHLGDSSEQRPPRSYATRVDPAPALGNPAYGGCPGRVQRRVLQLGRAPRRASIPGNEIPERRLRQRRVFPDLRSEERRLRRLLGRR